MNCGIYFIVSDHIGKPVLMLDAALRVTGVGEYDVNGHVNRVFHPADAPRDASGNHKTSQNKVVAYLQQRTVAGTNTFVRPRFAMVDTDSSARAYLADVNDNQLGTENFTGVNQGAMVGGWQQLNPITDSAGRFRVRFVSGSTNSNARKGVIFEGYEYARVETNAQRVWTPLRFPGQYHDQETDLFENWNRFYDPSIGRYLSPDPILLSPEAVMSMAASGMGTPAYAYANNNPIGFVDPEGLQFINSGATEEERARIAALLAEYMKQDAAAYSAMMSSDHVFAVGEGNLGEVNGNPKNGQTVSGDRLTSITLDFGNIAKGNSSPGFTFAHEARHAVSEGNRSGAFAADDPLRAYGSDPYWERERSANAYARKLTGLDPAASRRYDAWEAQQEAHNTATRIRRCQQSFASGTWLFRPLGGMCF